MSFSEPEAQAPSRGLALLLSEFTEPGRRGPTQPRRARGQCGILMIFLPVWQLMANYGEFQVDLFGDYLHRQTDGQTRISLFGAALMA